MAKVSWIWSMWTDSAGAELGLTPTQWIAVHDAAQKHAPKSATMAIIASVVLANLYMFWPAILGVDLPVWLRFVHYATYFVIYVIVYRWIYIRRMQPHVRAAIVRLGFARICIHCGYNLSRLSTGQARCPECGISVAESGIPPVL